MQRPFIRDTLICLFPVVLALIAVISAYKKYTEGRGGFKLGVDLVGGTILVYEVDQERTKLAQSIQQSEDGSGAGTSSADIPIDQLAARLKQRIDPADLRNITIRPVGKTRVEIILPTGGSSYQANLEGKKDLSSEEVEEIKRLISNVGSLEFRIIACDEDGWDREGVRAAMDLIERSKTNPELKKKFEDAALAGLPPPAPEGTFDVGGAQVRYAWVELGKQERRDMNLDNAAEFLSAENADTSGKGRPRDNVTWNIMKAAREKNEAHRFSGEGGGKASSYILYSREFKSRRVTTDDRDKKYEYFVLTRVPDAHLPNVEPVSGLRVDGKDITITAFPDQDRELRPAVGFRFNSYGGQKFYSITSKNRPRGSITGRLGIVLDGYIVSMPTLNEAIRDQGQISGRFTKEEVDQLVAILRAGALPATLNPVPVSENTIGPTLGLDTIKAGTTAVIAAFIAVLVFMLFYYEFAGLVACIALLANLLLTVGFMVALNATFTLPGLAGLVLMLGMAVDANVLIYERLREERDRGASVAQALRNGYDRAFPTIIDTHLANIFTAIVLYSVGNDQLKGFGVSLTVGLVISLFTSLYMTRLIFDFWLAKGRLTELRMRRFFSRPNIQFMAIRKVMMPITVVLMLIGLGLFLFRGKDGLNVDFIGGTAYGGQLVEPIDITSLRAQLSEERQKKMLQVGDLREIESNTYEVTYVLDGRKTSHVLRLSSPPEGDTPEARLESLKARLSNLPDWSVEQIFLTTDSALEGKSRFFTVRTTERQSAVVQAILTRLFTDPNTGESMLVSSRMAFTPGSQGEWTLDFTQPKSNEPAYTSVSFVKTLLDQEFLAAFAKSNPELAAEGVQLVGSLQQESPTERGRFAKMTVTFPSGVTSEQASAILARVKTSFELMPPPERLETFDGTLAAEMRSRAFYAIVASWIVILLYLWFRFGNWTFGLAAVLCLIHDLSFTLGAIAVCHYIYDLPGMAQLGIQDFKIDLPAVAALLTLVGYSVNDTIVVFDRIREVRGKNPLLTPQMINDSINQTLSRTVLASLTTFLVVAVLYWLGGDGVHLFAFVMVVGVLIGTYSSIYIASPLLLILGEGTPATAAPQATEAERDAARSKAQQSDDADAEEDTTDEDSDADDAADDGSESNKAEAAKTDTSKSSDRPKSKKKKKK